MAVAEGVAELRDSVLQSLHDTGVLGKIKVVARVMDAAAAQF